MTDKQWIARVRRIKDPVKMLQHILDHSEFFGYDPYYADLRHAMLEQAEKIVGAAKPSK